MTTTHAMPGLPRQHSDARQRELAWFLLTAVSTSVVLLVLHAVSHSLVVRHAMEAFPAGPPEFVRQLARPMNELVIWAMALTSLTMGLLVTTVMRWTGSTTITQGLWRGAALGALYWTAVNSGLYASSHHFSLQAVVVDTPMSALCMMLASAFAVWMLNARRRIEP